MHNVQIVSDSHCSQFSIASEHKPHYYDVLLLHVSKQNIKINVISKYKDHKQNNWLDR